MNVEKEKERIREKAPVSCEIADLMDDAKSELNGSFVSQDYMDGFLAGAVYCEKKMSGEEHDGGLAAYLEDSYADLKLDAIARRFLRRSLIEAADKLGRDA